MWVYVVGNMAGICSEYVVSKYYGYMGKGNGYVGIVSRYVGICSGYVLLSGLRP